MSRPPNPWWAPLAFCPVGLGLAAIGGWHVVWHHAIESEPERVIGVVIDSGSHTTSGRPDTRWLQYRFKDQTGRAHEGRSSGYFDAVGETIAVEYARSRPGFNRVEGEGDRPATRWRWAILGAGLLFLVAGMHSGWVAWQRSRR